MELTYEQKWNSPDKMDWREYRALLEGHHRQLVDDLLRRRFPDAAQHGQLVQMVLDFLQRFSEETAPALQEPPQVSGSPEAVQLIDQYGDVLDQAWRIRRIVNACWVHFVMRDGQPVLELIMGDQIHAVDNPNWPGELAQAQQMAIRAGDGEVVYTRVGDEILMQVKDREGVEKAAATIQGPYPIFGFYRSRCAQVVPDPDIGLLDQQKAYIAMLTDIDFQRYNMPGGWKLKTQTPGKAKSIKLGPHRVQELEDGEDLSALPPGGGGTFVGQLEYAENWLRLVAVLRGLHPDTFSIKSRAETGAAKAEERSLNKRITRADRLKAVKVMATFGAWLSSVMSSGLRRSISVQIAPAATTEEPSASELLQSAQAAELRAKLGMESVAEAIARERNISVEQAQQVLMKNLASWRNPGDSDA